MKTKTVTVAGFIHFDPMRARHADIWQTPFVFREYEPQTGSESVLVGEQTITLEVPEEFDPRPGMVKALEAKKEKARAEFAALVTQIDRQINELLALEA